MSGGFLIFVDLRDRYRRSAERRVVLPEDVVSWKWSDGRWTRGQVCLNTFTERGRVRVIELDNAGEVLRQTTVHPTKIRGHVSKRMDLVLQRPCPGCGADPKLCSCPTWAPLPIVQRETAA